MHDFCTVLKFMVVMKEHQLEKMYRNSNSRLKLRYVV